MNAELFRAMGALSEAPRREHSAIAHALGLPNVPSSHEHAALFVFDAYPYASVYVGTEGMVGGEAADRVAGFWRALGYEPPSEPDHIASLLALYGALLDSERSAPDAARATLLREARRALLWEHVLAWMPPYLTKLIEVAPPFYRAWGELVLDALLSEARACGAPSQLPLHLRAAPALPGREAGADDFLAALLAPVRSGLILVRTDLARGARGAGVGLRMGERRYALKAMLTQDPNGTLEWLAAEASMWRARHRAFEPVLGVIARFWDERAGAAAALLSESIEAAKELVGHDTGD